jgi:hypothetical protein
MQHQEQMPIRLHQPLPADRVAQALAEDERHVPRLRQLRFCHVAL